MGRIEIKQILIAFYAIGLIFVIIFIKSCERPVNNENQSLIADTVALTRTWERPIPNQSVPEGLKTIRAEECGLCHIEIFKEWKSSIHSVAFQDPQFQSEWKKDGVYVCLNCHTPLQNQQEFIVAGLINGDHKNPVKIANEEFDEVLKYESITCATCHVREGTVIGAKGHPDSPHAVRIDPEFLSEQICISCHNVSDELSPSLVCTFETGDEWMKTSKRDQGFTCVSCHMPITKRAISEFGEVYESHKHHFPGSGIPKFADMEIEGLQGLEIVEGKFAKAYKSGDSLNYALMIKNSYAGHSLPSGDPERFYLIDFKLMDINGNQIDRIQFRIGEKWQWYPVAKKISDNNIKSMEEREYQYTSVLVEPGEFILNVNLTKHRITEENARYNKLPDDYPRFISVFSKSYTITVNP